MFKLTEEHVSLIRISWRGFKREALILFHSLTIRGIEEKRLEIEQIKKALSSDDFFGFSDPVPLQRSPIGFSLKSYSCGLCGMYHGKQTSCMPDMRPRDSEKGLLGFHEFYGSSYHAEDFDIDEFVFDYLTSSDVLNGARS